MTAIANGFAIIKASVYDSVSQWETVGEAWLTVGLPTWEHTGLTGLQTWPVAVNKTSGIVFTGTNGSGVYRSVDAGVSWSAANNGMTHWIVYTSAERWLDREDGVAVGG
ncbi:MAG: hypothetical protein JSW51_10730 [Gemmatimonadota bacterium]|nr:MAG: hypothetical protein JSW51_10730 [Gemmatimonadota bacterium]